MNINDEKKGEEIVKKDETPLPKMREIIISTDGNNVNLVKADVAGKIELIGILQSLIGYLNSNK